MWSVDGGTEWIAMQLFCNKNTFRDMTQMVWSRLKFEHMFILGWNRANSANWIATKFYRMLCRKATSAIRKEPSIDSQRLRWKLLNQRLELSIKSKWHWKAKLKQLLTRSINFVCYALDLIELHEKLGMKLEIAQDVDSISERELSVFGGAIY